MMRAKDEVPAVTVCLMGGLGNQLFQYAFGRRLSLANTAKLYLDATAYRSDSLPDHDKGIRVFGLTHFNIAGEVIGAETRTRGRPSGVRRKLKKVGQYLNRMADKRKPYFLRSEIVEPAEYHFRFDHRLYHRTINGPVSVRGYWQSPCYFSAIESVLRKELTIRCEMDAVSARLAMLIKGTCSVAVHVRHGDNANAVAAELGVLPEEYYAIAIRDIGRDVANPHFFVFSDDMAWARQVVTAADGITYVEQKVNTNSHEDLRLMTLCQHHIIANSTFGWWGAWLGKKDGQIVYAPRRYYQNIDRPNPDLYPVNWRLI